jgi:hypothetical protein
VVPFVPSSQKPRSGVVSCGPNRRPGPETGTGPGGLTCGNFRFFTVRRLVCTTVGQRRVNRFRKHRTFEGVRFRNSRSFLNDVFCGTEQESASPSQQEKNGRRQDQDFGVCVAPHFNRLDQSIRPDIVFKSSRCSVLMTGFYWFLHLQVRYTNTITRLPQAFLCQLSTLSETR